MTATIKETQMLKTLPLIVNQDEDWDNNEDEELYQEEMDDWEEELDIEEEVEKELDEDFGEDIEEFDVEEREDEF